MTSYRKKKIYQQQQNSIQVKINYVGNYDPLQTYMDDE